MAFQKNEELHLSFNDLHSSIDNFSVCQICVNPFGDKENCPRILSCGHTLCHSCLHRFISEGPSVCPYCKEGFNFISADDITINFSVKNLSDLVNKMLANTQEFPYEGHCDEHFSPNNFKCLDCNKYACGICAVLMHKSCTNVLLVLEALNLKKGEKLEKIRLFKTKLIKEANLLNTKINILNRKQQKLYEAVKRNKKMLADLICHEENLEKSTCEDFDKVDAKAKLFMERCILPPYPPLILSIEDAMLLTSKDIKENTCYVMKSDDDELKYAKMSVNLDYIISFEEWEDKVEAGSFCFDFLGFINLGSSAIDTHNFIEKHKKELHNPKLPKDRLKCSKIEVKKRVVYFHSFKSCGLSHHFFEFESLLKTLGCPSIVPTEAFLIGIDRLSGDKGHVVITTDGGSPMAINFLLLASGIMDDSYIGTCLSNDGSSVNGGYRKEEPLSPGVVFQRLQNENINQSELANKGDVLGYSANGPLPYFNVERDVGSYPLGSNFGTIKRGMNVVDQIKGGEELTECGLVLDVPVTIQVNYHWTIKLGIFFYGVFYLVVTILYFCL